MAEKAAQKKLILFDLVSTITDAGPRYAEAYLRMAAAYNLPIPSREDILAELGQRSLKEIISIHSPDLPVERIGEFMNDCNNACDTMLYDVRWIETLYPGVRDALAELKNQGFTLGLYTGTRQDAMEAQLRYHNIAQYFDLSLVRAKDNIRDAGKDTQALKTEQIALILQSWREDYGQGGDVLVVGDTLSDYEAARANGAGFAGFAETPKKMDEFLRNNIKAVFSTYRNAAYLLGTLLADAHAPARKANPPGLGS